MSKRFTVDQLIESVNEHVRRCDIIELAKTDATLKCIRDRHRKRCRLDDD